MKALSFCVLFLSFGFSNILAQTGQPPAQDKLDAITERGKKLYAYDVAAWHATDAVIALKPTDSSFTLYRPPRWNELDGCFRKAE